jgi:hypothetical protein
VHAQPRARLRATAREIEARVLELGFVTPFLAELRALSQTTTALRPWRWLPGLGTLGRVRWHAMS